MTKVQLVSSKSEICAGTRGASLGFDAIRIASTKVNSHYFENRSIREIPNENDLLFSSPKTTSAINISGLKKVFGHFTEALKEVFHSDSFPLIIAGDHSTAAATIAGIKATFPEKRLGAIWIDAHADLHSPYTTPTGNMHGMPLAISIDQDNLAKRNPRKIDKSIESDWNDLKNWGGICPKMNPSDLVLIGVRDTEEPEDYLMEELNIKNFSVDDVHSLGAETIATSIEKYLSECDQIYISFDVDSMDCNLVSHGTGTPVPNGLSPIQANALLLELLKNEKVICLEITEVNPTLDEKGNRMAETAFEILQNCTRAIEYRNR